MSLTTALDPAARRRSAGRDAGRRGEEERPCGWLGRFRGLWNKAVGQSDPENFIKAHQRKKKTTNGTNGSNGFTLKGFGSSSSSSPLTVGSWVSHDEEG